MCHHAETRIKLPRRHGFTLIELMIVIGIVAIIAATGVPVFVRGLRKEGLRKAVSDVVEGCSHARAQAILQGVPTEFVIRSEDGQMTVRPLQVRTSEEGGEAGFAPVSAPAKPMANFRANLPDEIAVKQLFVNFQDQMDLLEAHVRFFPNGTSDEFSVLLSSLAAEQLISLDVVTGMTEVKVVK